MDKIPVLTANMTMAVCESLLKAHKMANMESMDHTCQYNPDSVTSSIWPAMHQMTEAMAVKRATIRLSCQSVMMDHVLSRMANRVKKHHVEKISTDFVRCATPIRSVFSSSIIANKATMGMVWYIRPTCAYVSIV